MRPKASAPVPRRRSSSSVELPAGSAARRAEIGGRGELVRAGVEGRGAGYAGAAAATAMPARVWGFMRAKWPMTRWKRDGGGEGGVCGRLCCYLS